MSRPPRQTPMSAIGSLRSKRVGGRATHEAVELSDAPVSHRRMADELEGDTTSISQPRHHSLAASMRVRLQRGVTQQWSAREICVALGGGTVLLFGATQLTYGLFPQLLPIALREALNSAFGRGQQDQPSPSQPLVEPAPPLPSPPPPCYIPSPPPRPPPSPPSAPPMPIVDQLNMRFKAGKPSDDVSRAGVLVHQFDGQEDWAKRWMPCSSTETWCQHFHDRFATSIIAADYAHLFNQAGGLIFRMSPPSTNEIFCSFPADGGTMSNICSPPGPSETCVPGCWHGTPNWCTLEKTWQCAFRPDDFGAMLRAHTFGQGNKNYNEVILSTAHYVANLPHSLEAMFVTSRNDAETRQAHALFLTTYGYTASQFPLVLLNIRDTAAPFIDISPAPPP